MATQVLVIGDSHTHAIKQALKRRPTNTADFVQFAALRFPGVKNGRDVGDLSVDRLEEMVANLLPDDLVVSCLGGNQHQKLALVQHPQPFDVLLPDDVVPNPQADLRIIPYQQVVDLIERGIRTGRDGERLRRLRELARCHVVHLMPPPPKEDVSHVLSNPESPFAKAGIHELGVSPAPLRLKFWKIQALVLADLTSEWGISLLPPPSAALTPEGFLATRYYADDATHGNSLYGALVLEQLKDFVTRIARHS